jgi:exodeoxyribonuclease V alpha subunit
MQLKPTDSTASPDDLARAVAAGILNPLEAAVAAHLCDRAGVSDAAVRFVAALAIRAPRLGDVCAAPWAFDALAESRRARALRADTADSDTDTDLTTPTDPENPSSPSAAAIFVSPPDLAARLAASGLFDLAHTRDIAPHVHDPLIPVARAPFVMDTRGPELLVWTDRYFTIEARLAAHVAARAVPTPANNLAARAIDPLAHVAPPLAPWFKAIFPEAIAPPTADHPDYPWSALAAALGLTAPLAILTGGPGTGKTYAVRKMLLLHRIAAALDGRPAPRLALAAPTGKAAARLREALVDQLDAILAAFNAAILAAGLVLPPGLELATLRATIAQATPMTLHRLLRIHPDRPTRPHHGAQNPLPADLVVIDEASMVDLPLMTRLFDALAPTTRLLILGDHHQLASVEAGSVLGDLVALPSFHHPSFPTATTAATAATIPVVALRRSRRFSDATPMGRFARALTATPFDHGRALELAAHDADSEGGTFRRLIPPDAWPVLPPVDTPSSDPRTRRFAAAIDDTLRAGFLPYLLELHTGPAPGEDDDAHLARVLATFDTFRVLCAHRRGALGVEALNRRVPALLARLDPASHPGLAPLVRNLARALPAADSRAAFQTAPAYWPGRPLLVTRNDPTLGLQNGDVGIVANRTGSDWRIAFPGATSGTVRWVAASLLPPHETAFAMTIHKSQGSQYRHVMVVLPERESPIVTRELVYTAVTRMTRDVTLVANPRVLALALAQTVTRRSDLTRLILANLASTP